MKLHLSKPTLPKLLTHWSLKVFLCLLLLAALVAFGAVRYEQQQRQEEQKQAAIVAAQQAKDAAVQKQIQELTAQRDASCVYLASLTQNKATKSLVIVPTASGCPFPKK